jgi:formyltetrahydrofolate deformylase
MTATSSRASNSATAQAARSSCGSNSSRSTALRSTSIACAVAELLALDDVAVMLGDKGCDGTHYSCRGDFAATAGQFGMAWRLLAAAGKQRVLILVSKYGHCLNDLLYRANSGALNIDVPAVISNHPDLGMLADTYSVPFRHISVTPETKPDAEKQLLSAIDELNIDLVVLARYMQILSSDLCKQLEGRAINIHHSMLPSFKGARPYQQAYERGVKVIGATAHYVTPDLDEGPIIEQAVTRINHTMTAAQVTQFGRDNECLALARAVQWHTENRVLLDGRRTVVFQ